LRTIVSSLLLICGILVVYMMLAAFPVPVAAQENLVGNGDFSQGLQQWTVGFPTNPCEPGNLSEWGGYYGCVMVTDEGTPGNPHLELYTGSGGEYGMERFEQGVSQTLSRLPKDAGRVIMSLRVWSLENTSYVRTMILTGSRENLTLEEMHDFQSDWYESYYYPSREPTTITRDITNFHDPTSYLFVGGDRVAIDDITVVATPEAPERLTHETELIKNGDFSLGPEHWKYWNWNSSCCMQISDRISPGNPYLELHEGAHSSVSQEVQMPEDVTRISFSIKARALTPPGQNPENVSPWVMVRITSDGSIFQGMNQETYWFLRPALRMEPVITTITRDLTGFNGKNITLTLTGEEAAVDDVTLLAYKSVSTTTNVIPPPTNPQMSNATLEYDLTNRLTENDTTCTYEWGPMLALNRTGDQFSLNFSSTSPIDVYVFDAYFYNGTLSCRLGPYAPQLPEKIPPVTGTQGQLGSVLCLGCEPGMSSYILFINHDPTVIPHVTLEVAVKLHAATTTTTTNPPPSAVPFIGVPEILIAILLGLFIVARTRRRGSVP
jgi:hypothetical protein